MPFTSQSQWRAFFAKEARGELPPGAAKRWAEESPPFHSLPKRAGKKDEKRKKKRRVVIVHKAVSPFRRPRINGMGGFGLTRRFFAGMGQRSVTAAPVAPATGTGGGATLPGAGSGFGAARLLTAQPKLAKQAGAQSYHANPGFSPRHLSPATRFNLANGQEWGGTEMGGTLHIGAHHLVNHPTAGQFDAFEVHHRNNTGELSGRRFGIIAQRDSEGKLQAHRIVELNRGHTLQDAVKHHINSPQGGGLGAVTPYGIAGTREAAQGQKEAARAQRAMSRPARGKFQYEVRYENLPGHAQEFVDTMRQQHNVGPTVVNFAFRNRGKYGTTEEMIDAYHEHIGFGGKPTPQAAAPQATTQATTSLSGKRQKMFDAMPASLQRHVREMHAANPHLSFEQVVEGVHNTLQGKGMKKSLRYFVIVKAIKSNPQQGRLFAVVPTFGSPFKGKRRIGGTGSEHRGSHWSETSGLFAQKEKEEKERKNVPPVYI